MPTIPAGDDPMVEAPWCCHPACTRDADLRLRDTSDCTPYDQRETDACVEHAEYLGLASEGVLVVGLLPAFDGRCVKTRSVGVTWLPDQRASRANVLGIDVRCRCGGTGGTVVIDAAGEVSRLCAACVAISGLDVDTAEHAVATLGGDPSALRGAMADWFHRGGAT